MSTFMYLGKQSNNTCTSQNARSPYINLEKDELATGNSENREFGGIFEEILELGSVNL